MQSQWIAEAHQTHVWERSPIKQFAFVFKFSILFWLGKSTIITVLAFAFFENIVAYQNFPAFTFSLLFFESITFTLVCQMSYLLRQRRFIKKESKSFQYLSRVTEKRALQDLVSPHFLFNSLNTAASIIPDDQETGLKFVTDLTDLYGFILKNNESQLISLEEEIEIVEKYGYLIRTRFGENFSIHLSIPEQYKTALIPPLGLQNLVENASKHNAVTKKRPLILEVFIESDFVVVRNNINPKKTFINESTNLGLDYIRSQIEQFSKLRMEVDHGEEYFTVKIPLIYPSTLN